MSTAPELHDNPARRRFASTTFLYARKPIEEQRAFSRYLCRLWNCAHGASTPQHWEAVCRFIEQKQSEVCHAPLLVEDCKDHSATRLGQLGDLATLWLVADQRLQMTAQS